VQTNIYDEVAWYIARHVVCLQSYHPTETVWCNRFTQQNPKPKLVSVFGFSKSITALVLYSGYRDWLILLSAHIWWCTAWWPWIMCASLVQEILPNAHETRESL